MPHNMNAIKLAIDEGDAYFTSVKDSIKFDNIPNDIDAVLHEKMDSIMEAINNRFTINQPAKGTDEFNQAVKQVTEICRFTSHPSIDDIMGNDALTDFSKCFLIIRYVMNSRKLICLSFYESFQMAVENYNQLLAALG